LINRLILSIAAEPFDPAGHLTFIRSLGRHQLKMTAFALDNPGHHPGQGVQMAGLVARQLFRVKLQ
jgi:hypothetical protein